MGLFGKKRSPLEKRLLEEYSNLLAPQLGSAREGRRAAEEWLEQARELAEKAGTLGLSNLAENYFAMAASDPAVEAKLAAKRKDGVTDEDIRWWWNIDELERRMMCISDEHARMAMYLYQRQELGLSPKKAGAAVNRNVAFYSDTSEPGDPHGDNRALPFELKDRINKWVIRMMSDPEAFKRRLASVSSFNALVRQTIRAGDL